MSTITHEDYFNAVLSLPPGSRFGVRDDADGVPVLEWDDANAQARPTDNQIIAEANRLASLLIWPGSKPMLQATQIAQLSAAYENAIAQPVSFATAGGVAKTFQADPVSIQNLSSMLAAFTPAGAAPAGFYWVSADNTQVSFSLADMQGLAKAIGNQGWSAFQHLQEKKGQVLAATTQADIEAITW